MIFYLNVAQKLLNDTVLQIKIFL